MEARKGDWIQTSTGVKFYPLDPRVSDVEIFDIAHHLANVNRFTGATREPYSVAQHSVHVSHMVPPEDALWGLLHDASEAYLNDVARPLKNLPEWGTYRELESRVMQVICVRFGLPVDEPESVKMADKRLLRAEQRDLMPPPSEGEDRSTPVAWPGSVEPWHWTHARSKFLQRFEYLTYLTYRGGR